MLPIDNLSVGVMGILGAEGRPANQALKHDRSDGPPITAKGVALTSEDLGGDVVGGTNSGVSDATTGLTPCIDLAAAHGKINLIQCNRVAIVARLLRAALDQLLIVSVVMLLVKSS